jgi:type III pantothenate kinase
MLLTIDIGNTRIKWAVFNAAGELQMQTACLHQAIESINFFDNSLTINRAIIANVADESVLQKVLKKLEKTPFTLAQSSAKAGGVTNGYESPVRLGIDRWAAVVAAWQIVQKPVLVINAGTAVTLDVIDARGYFLGGSILPGLRLMQESLAKNTAQLPIGQGNVRLFATNTQDAIMTGCMRAIVGAITIVANNPQFDTQALQIIISGGDAAQIVACFDENLAKHTIIVDNLVCYGLMALEREVK